MGRFRRGSHVFQNQDVLREDHRPQNLEERDEELDEYTYLLNPVINGDQPNNIFLYGPTGVGKTVATHSLLEELVEDARAYDDVDVNVVELNCTGLTSSYQLAINLVNEFRMPEHQITTVDLDKDPLPETGLPQKRVMRELRSDIGAVGGTVLIILDEIDHIGTDDDILYELPRARKNYNLDAKIGIIGISNDFGFIEGLDPRAADTLGEEELHFPPYDANDLRAILQKRATKAFHDDVDVEKAIALCAAYAAKDRGSARQALDLLRKAGDFAEREARENDNQNLVVTEEHVERANKAIERQQVKEGVRSLTDHAKLCLLTVALLEAEGETPERTRIIFQRYQEVARAHNLDPLKRRRIHDHLSNLDLNGILEQVDKSAGKGNKNYYELDLSLDSVLEVLDETATNFNTDAVREISESTSRQQRL